VKLEIFRGFMVAVGFAVQDELRWQLEVFKMFGEAILR
jgi:hypothetical protein